jgi:leucyl aminopeptidase
MSETESPRLTFEVTPVAPADVVADLLLLPIFEDNDPSGTCAGVEAALGSSLAAISSAAGAGGKLGELAVVPTFGRLRAGAIGLLGLGPRSATSQLNRTRAAMMRAAERIGGFRIVATTVHQAGPDVAGAAAALVEGLELGLYSYRQKPAQPTLRMLVDAESAASVFAAAAGGRVYGTAANWVRRLVDGPPNEVTPAALAAAAERLAASPGLSCRIWELLELEAAGFGAIIAVGGASRNPPRLIELEYRGAGEAPWHGLVGKGVTFDSGGLDIKGFENMLTMKSDMAGGAVVLASVHAAAELRLPLNIVAVVPAVENALGPEAYRPGDVIRHRGGKTSEIVSTDAEGRLILGDGVAYVTERRPAVIIDVATLTRSILGEEMAPIFATDGGLARDLIEAGAEAGEALWELPLADSCHRYIESEVADLKNTEPGINAGTVVGALFIREFAGDVPWAHIDIAGTAYHRKPRGPWPAGATGSGARLLIRYLENAARRSLATEER